MDDRMDRERLIPRLSTLIDETLARTRQYAHDSFPMELESLGLRGTIGSLCNEIAGQVNFRCDFQWSIPEDVPFTAVQQINIYRIIQEALQNAIKHSAASLVTVTAQKTEKDLIFSVKDNGMGNPRLNSKRASFRKEKLLKGLGLRSMEYRANQIGADYRITSSGAGTVVEIRLS
jgi:signal transduction histidine kinase